MKHFFSRYKWHVLFWGTYVVFWTIMSGVIYHNAFIMAFLLTLVWGAGQATLSYLNIYWLIPHYLANKRYFMFALLELTGLVVGAAFITLSLVTAMHWANLPMKVTIWQEFLYNVLGNFYMVFLVVALKSLKDKLSSDRRHAVLEKEKTYNELLFLKSQMNPHFLFNSINSIYALIRKDPEFAAEALLKFSDMLRYQLYECNCDLIPIEKEIQCLDNYIALEKLRKGGLVETEYSVGESMKNFRIAPLLILPFVENAFKYVSACPEGKNTITVGLSYQDEIFELCVENTIDDEEVTPKGKSWGGIGLENVRRRLDLMYPARHALEIGRSGGIYSAVLTIKVR